MRPSTRRKALIQLSTAGCAALSLTDLQDFLSEATPDTRLCFKAQ